MLELKTLKLDTPEFFAGDLFIRKNVAGLAVLLFSEHLPRMVTSRDADGVPTSFKLEDTDIDELHQIANLIVDEICLPPIEIAVSKTEQPLDDSKWDTVHLHGASLLRHALIYMETRHSIKHGDPGRLLLVYRFLGPIFRATGRSNYASEMLEVLHRCRHEWGPTLRTTILAHSLVNTTGKPDGWLGIDQYQEHDVRTHKVDFALSQQRNDDNELHKKISPLLHTFRAIRTSFWKKFELCGLKTSKANNRLRDHAYTLAKAFHKEEVIKWKFDRRSLAYETAQGQLKEWTKVYDPENANRNFKATTTDPLKKGYVMMMDTEASTSIVSYFRRRVHKVTHTLMFALVEALASYRMDTDDDTDLELEDE